MNIKIEGDRLWAVVDQDDEIASCIMEVDGQSHWMPMVCTSREALLPMRKAAEALAKKFELDYRLIEFQLTPFSVEKIKVR